MRPSLLVAAVLVAVALPATAQDWAGRGRLQGEVTDPAGKPVAGARITLRWGDNPELGPPPLTTDKRGRWSYLGLDGGNWTVLIEADGFVAAEGAAQANEFGPSPAIRVQLNPITEQMKQEAAESTAVAAIEKGNQFLIESNYAAARAEYEKALAELDAPNQPPVLRGIARTYFQEEKPAEAITVLEKALAIAPDDVESLRLIVSLLVANSREKEAEQYIAKLPADTTLDPNAVLNMGITHYNAGEYDPALEDFERVVRENPEMVDGYYYRGLCFLAKGMSAEAKADFEKVVALDPNGRQGAEAKEYLKSL